MTAVIQNTNVHTSSIQSTASTHVHQTTSWKGFHVQSLPQGAMKAADMAEEMALSVASFGADKSIKKKQVEDKKDKKVSASSELMPGMPLYEAEVFVRALKQQGAKNAQATLELVQKFFRDPTAQDAALRFAKEHMPSDERAFIDVALKTLHEKSGKDIRAGYNIAPIEHQDLSAQQARDCYRFHILNYKSYEETFKNLMQEYAPGKLTNTVEFLRKALGADMQALEPSCSNAQLHEVAEGLYIVQNLTNLYAQTEKLCLATAKRFNDKEPEAKVVMQGLLAIKDNVNITEPSLRRQLPFLASKNPTRDAVFVRAVREIARNLPTKLYSSEAQRQKVLQTLQQNLDKAIDREDAEEE